MEMEAAQDQENERERRRKDPFENVSQTLYYTLLNGVRVEGTSLSVAA